MQPSHELKPPVGYCSFGDWVASSPDRKKRFKSVTFGDKEVALTRPSGLENPVHWRLRFPSESKTHVRHGFIATMPGGRVCNEMCHIISPDNQLISDFSLEGKKQPTERSIYHSELLPPLHKTSGTIAMLAIKDSGVYYHWMLDVLPRIHLLNKCGITPDYYLINGGRQSPFQRTTLAALGVPEERIIPSHDQLHIQAKELVIPGFTKGIRAKWACDFLKAELMVKRGIAPVKGFERLYISREHARKRKLVNEEEVMGVLSKYGFRKVILESMPLTEQIRIFASAKVVAGPHGAGFTNLVFSNPGTKVIEFFSPNHVHNCYPILSSLLRHRHYYLIGKGERPPEFVNPHARDDDITIHVKDLKKLLKLAGIK